MRHRVAIAVLSTGVLAAAAGPASAQRHAGVRAGVSAEPDQFFVGAHVETEPLVDALTFRPSVEVGVGDDRTLVSLNVEFAYWIPIPDQAWRFYVGGGPAANLYSFGDDHPGRGGNDSDVAGGFNLFVGLQHAGGLLTEVKVGALDSPSIKFSVGYAFR